MRTPLNPFRRARRPLTALVYAALLSAGVSLGLVELNALLLQGPSAGSSFWFTVWIVGMATATLAILLVDVALDWRAYVDRRLALVGAAFLVPGDIVSQIGQAILSFFQQIWNGIASFFGSIFGAISTAISSIFLAPVNAINSSFTSLENWANQFGPLAPLITVAIVALVFIMVIWLVWFLIRFSIHAGGTAATEVEEGA